VRPLGIVVTINQRAIIRGAANASAQLVSLMNVSLEQAIEIHARALSRRFKNDAPANARQRAAQLKEKGDYEGHLVWLDVAETSQRLLSAGEEPLYSAAQHEH
jgi:hypothetical protein